MSFKVPVLPCSIPKTPSEMLSEVERRNLNDFNGIGEILCLRYF